MSILSARGELVWFVFQSAVSLLKLALHDDNDAVREDAFEAYKMNPNNYPLTKEHEALVHR